MTARIDRRKGRRRRASRSGSRTRSPSSAQRTGRAPGLAVVLVGEDPASAVYVRSKGKATIEAGMASFEHNLPARHQRGRAARAGRPSSTPIQRSTASSSSCRCRAQIDADAGASTRIDPDKDVDGFHPVNAGRLAIGLARLRALHAARLPEAAQGRARRPVAAWTRW